MLYMCLAFANLNVKLLFSINAEKISYTNGATNTVLLQ